MLRPGQRSCWSQLWLLEHKKGGGVKVHGTSGGSFEEAPLQGQNGET